MNTETITHTRNLRRGIFFTLCVCVSNLLATTPLAFAAEPLRATGLIAPSQEVEVAASSDGVLREILVEEGQEIREGDVLARLESSREAIEVEYYKVILDQRIADEKIAKKLFEDGIHSKEKWDEKTMEMKSAEANYRLAQQKLADKTIKAPVSGVALRRYKARGESIKNLDPFVRLVSLDQLTVTAYFDGEHLARVQRGQRARVVVPSQNQQEFWGVVEVVDAVVDRASGMFRVKINLPNAERRVRAGVTCQVEVTDAPRNAEAP
jgi:membrane fusion protein (multidrug efflux system)